MFQCADCDAAYLDPRPTATSLALAYRNYYTHDNHGDHGAGLAKRLRRGYINARYGFRAEPASRLGAFVLPLFPRLRASWDKNCRHLPRLPHRGARLLDLGSGDGSFLALAATAGWAVEGIDTDPEAVRIAASRGITVTEGSAQHLHFADARFDVVTLNHVIEHSHDPSAVLRECWRVLRPGGVLWIATPNCASWCHRWFGAAWRGLEPPRHLVLFTRGALERLLRDARFYDLRFRWAGIQARFYGETSRAIGLGSGSGVGHPPFYESLLWLVFDWTSRFALTRAEELVVQARKPACA